MSENEYKALSTAYEVALEIAKRNVLDAQRYRTIRTMSLMAYEQWEKLQPLVESIRNQFNQGKKDNINCDTYTDACTAVLEQQAGDMK